MWMTIVGVVVIGGAVLLIFVTLNRVQMPWLAAGGIQAPFTIFIFAIIPIRLRFYRRIDRLLDEHKDLICTNCAYPLDGLASEGKCPECSVPYEHGDVNAQWQIYRRERFWRGMNKKKRGL